MLRDCFYERRSNLNVLIRRAGDDARRDDHGCPVAVITMHCVTEIGFAQNVRRRQ